MNKEEESTNDNADGDNISVLTQDEVDNKSAFGPGFRKWLRMKRALRLVQEQKYPDPMYIPRIRYKVQSTAKARTRNVLDEDSVDDTMVMDALLNRDTHPILDMLRDGLSPDYRVGPLRKTLLQLVAQKGDRDIVDILIEFGADVNAVDNNNDSALYLALNTPRSFHHVSILWKLYEQGANINHANKDGWTPLHRACLLGDTELVSTVLAMGAEVYCLDAKNMLPLQYVKMNEDEIFRVFKKNATPRNKGRHHRMWAHMMSRSFVDALFHNVEPMCSICKRKVRKCGQMKQANYRYWLFIHKLKKK